MNMSNYLFFNEVLGLVACWVMKQRRLKDFEQICEQIGRLKVELGLKLKRKYVSQMYE